LEDEVDGMDRIGLIILFFFLLFFCSFGLLEGEGEKEEWLKMVESG